MLYFSNGGEEFHPESRLPNEELAEKTRSPMISVILNQWIGHLPPYSQK